MKTTYTVSVTECSVEAPCDPMTQISTKLTLEARHERTFADAEAARQAYFAASKAMTNVGIVPGYQDIVDRWHALTKHGVLGHAEVELKVAGNQLLAALEHELGRR